jgi:hypothetical protein
MYICYKIRKINKKSGILPPSLCKKRRKAKKEKEANEKTVLI